jgi:hypothetical protein
VTDATTEILLESALQSIFCAALCSLSQSAKRIELSVERGVDPLGVLVASARATRLIEELAGGRGDK